MKMKKYNTTFLSNTEPTIYVSSYHINSYSIMKTVSNISTLKLHEIWIRRNLKPDDIEIKLHLILHIKTSCVFEKVHLVPYFS